MEIYYPVVFRLKDKEYYCLWYSEDDDGFYKEDSELKCFENKEQMFHFAKIKNIVVEGDVTLIEMDIALNWLESKDNNINCKYFLNFWNIFSDLANTFDEKFYGSKKNGVVNKLYDKLFYGNNLSPMKGEGEEYNPILKSVEIVELSNVINDGLRLINKYLVK